MATIKSYTDIEQSKKLADILPHNTADNTWERVAIAGSNLNVPEELQYVHNGNMPFCFYSGIGVPCWSLAALLEQLPFEICDDDGNSVYLQINKENDVYQLVYTDPYGDFESIETDRYEHFIDACYEMVLKLHELNIL
jgi:hypothetical protein